MNKESVRILSSKLFDIFKYDEDPEGAFDFRALRHFYRGLPSETKKQITQDALALDPDVEAVLDQIDHKTSEPEDSKEAEALDRLELVMKNALFEMKSLVDYDLTQKVDFVQMVVLFLQGLISTAADLVEFSHPGAGAYLYSEIEAAVKTKRLGAKDITSQRESVYDSVSDSDLSLDDMEIALNQLGQTLSDSLFKELSKLPRLFQNQEMVLRGVEVLLVNLLYRNFDDPHLVLDHFCDHVYAALTHLSYQDNFAEKGKSETTH